MYSYNKNGDMGSRTINSGTQTDFTYSGNMMASADGNETFSLSYDENGNLIYSSHESPATSYEYNWDNKLRSAVKGSTSIGLKYDPMGNRIYKNSSEAGARKYIMDIVSDLPVILLELDASTFEVKKAYIYANSQIIAQYDGDWRTPLDCKNFYLHDRLGSVRQVMGCQAGVAALYTYNPFGETIEEDGSFTNPFRFTGQYYDSEISQYFLRARQYEPHLGRFVSRDPVLGNFEEPLRLHKYLYCGNDSINYIDLDGKFAIVVGCSISANMNLGSVFGVLGYNAQIFSLISGFGIGGTVGRGIFVVKNTDETGWFNFDGLVWGDITWGARGGSWATGSGGSFTGDFSYSPNAMKASDLGGWFTEYGGSVTYEAGPTFWFNTLGLTYSIGDNGTELYTFSAGHGLSFSWETSVEAHIYRGKALVNEW